MKINDNGVIRDMTPEEIAEMEQLKIEYEPRETPEERIEALENALLLLLEGKTE
jgi:hypothetical protein